MNKQLKQLTFVLSIYVIVLTGFAAGTVRADVAPWLCSMAHCTPTLSDQIGGPVFIGPVTQFWKYGTRGVGAGIAAVAGPDFTALTYSTTPSLVVLNSNGTERWNSGNQLQSLVKSAALVDSAGNIYVADDAKIVKFSAYGQLIWNVANPAGSAPFSMNVTAEGNLFGQGQAGSAWLVSQSTGVLLSQLTLTGTVGNRSGAYVTLNTAAVVGNRIYVVTHFSGNNRYGRLYALNSAGGILSVAWYWDFGGPSGSSPTVSGNRLYFDGRRLNAGDRSSGLFMFGVQDNGTAPQMLWMQNIAAASNGGTDIQVSPALDPRGGIWAFALHGSRLLRLNELTGATMQQLDLSALLGVGSGQYVPSSVMTIAVNNPYPVMYVGAMPDRGFGGPPKIIGLNLTAGSLAFAHNLEANTYAQFPIIPAGPVTNKSVLIVPTTTGGVFGLLGN